MKTNNKQNKLSNPIAMQALLHTEQYHYCSMPRTDVLFAKRTPAWKRLIDIAGSLAFMIMLCPVFLLVGVFIKAVSKGPIFFKQVRIGCGGMPFEIYKFRTMHIDADHEVHKKYLTNLIKSSQDSHNAGKPMEKIKQDQRIIKCGNFLRATGLDELPQLLNVLLGQMSLVGPRPAISYEVDQYPLWFRKRWDVLPGLTGLWQVSGKNRLGFNEMIRLDIQYVNRRSLILDLIILLKTPVAILHQIRDLQAGRC